MTDQNPSHVFLSYGEQGRGFVESLARRLQGDARLFFWFGPWRSASIDRKKRLKGIYR